MKNKFIPLIFATISLSAIGFITGFSYLFYKILNVNVSPNINKSKKTIKQDLKNLKIMNNYLNFDQQLDISPKSLVPISDGEVQVVNWNEIKPGVRDIIVKKYNNKIEDFNIVEEFFNNEYNQWYIEFQDPITKIKFREYAYYNDSHDNKRYLLGKNALVKIAQEFKRKVPFGPEVFDLEAININDFNVIPPLANGLYIPNNKNIYINAFNFLEKGIKLYSIVGSIMSVIFHEYLHHWSNSYAQIVLPDDKDENETSEDKKYTKYPIYYHGSSIENEQGHAQYWNGEFVKKFKNILNFNIDTISYLKNNPLYINANNKIKEKWISNNFSLKNLWDFSNTNNDFLNIKDNERYYFSPEGQYGLTKSEIRYYYSLTELVAREYTKYAFESYFPQDGLENTLLDPGLISNKVNFFNWYGAIESDNSKGNLVVSQYGQSNDWMRVYLSSLKNIVDNKKIKLNDYVIYPNTPFKFEYLTESKEKPNEFLTLKNKFKKDRSEEFYNLYLETMGYGKAIAQIFSKNVWKWNDLINNDNLLHSKINFDHSVSDEIKFVGYLPDKKYTGFAIIKKDKLIQKAKFQYSDTFSFFGHKNFDYGAFLNSGKKRKEQFLDRRYPKEHFYNYITEEFVKISNGSEVYFWTDLNNDNEIQENEIDFNKNISIPDQRRVTTLRDERNSDLDFYIEKSSNEKIQIKKILY
ncbi:MYPU_1760 family metalloprotease [Mycoplasmopsis cricetuli]|uniref:MYPU_1760 family metalloprotease n=1 Tax=Mycoplasmopsis cricetuli TaxID=171283 RepID=UPI0004723752|nr:hypothetical protein [Mycoplasmopsis cricetuli]